MNTPLGWILYWVGCFSTGIVLGILVEELVSIIKRRRK